MGRERHEDLVSQFLRELHFIEALDLWEAGPCLRVAVPSGTALH